MNDEEREYLNDTIRSLNNQLVDALRERDDAREQAERWEDDALRLMKERNEAMQKCDEHIIKTLQAYDRLSIVMDQVMEYWLEGHANPPKELINAYYDAKDDVGEHINVGRIHEQIIPHNGEFYEKIESQFGLDRRPNL
jgi:hypothetical protein